MKKLMLFTSIVEVITGIALLLIPEIIINLLLGNEFSDTHITAARIAGISLLILGFYCYPRKSFSKNAKVNFAFKVMFTYNFLVAVFLYYLEFATIYKGILLLPAAIYHTVITIIFISVFFKIKPGNVDFIDKD